MTLGPLLIWLAAVLGIALAAPPALAANTFVVNSTDTDDDGNCDPLPGDCTLPEAVAAVNAGQGKTIRFDPDVFPKDNYQTIVGVAISINSASGVTIDGSGAGVVLDGTGRDEIAGLALRSPSGETLSGVTVRDIALDNWEEEAIRLCGGSPGCTDPVTNFSIRGVVIDESEFSRGLVISGSEISKGDISDCSVAQVNNEGILIDGDSGVSNLTIRNTAVSDSDSGITVRSGGDITGLKILSSAVRGNTTTGILVEAANASSIASLNLSENTAVENGFSGITVTTDGGISKTIFRDNRAAGNAQKGARFLAGSISSSKIERNAFAGNGNDGLELGGEIKKTRVSDNEAHDNGQDGIQVNGSGNTTQVQVTKNRAVDNFDFGIWLSGCASKCKVERSDVSGNSGGLEIQADQSQISKNVANGNDSTGIGIVDSDKLKVTSNRTIGNTAGGIQLQNTTNSNIQKNVSRGYFAEQDDLSDDAPNCGSNVWKNNDFRLSNDPCIQ